MEKKYFVGIDFGHGETTVSRVPGINGLPVSQIPLTSDTKDAGKKVISAICKRGGEWSLVYGTNDYKNEDLREGFKGMIHTLTPQDREALQIFAQLIFKAILENDTDLEYDELSGERNFELGIACPTDWRRQEERPTACNEYVDFFRTECSLPVDHCINESDAAFFTKYDNYQATDSVFVVDLGSSTIDFTTFVGSRVKKELCWGANLGAHMIEDILKTHIIVGENRANLQDVVRLREQASFHGDVNTAVSLFIRKAKEDYYIQRQEKGGQLVVNVAKRELVPAVRTADPCVYAFIDSVQYDQAIAPYVSALQSTLMQAKQRLANSGVVPTRVLLSGGACRMPFFVKIIKELFSTSKIDIDTQPECVVSNGVALFARARAAALSKVVDRLNRLDYDTLYKDADRTATREAIQTLLPSVLADICGGNDKSGDTIRTMLCNFMKGLNGNNSAFCKLVRTEVDHKINSNVRSAMAVAFADVFGITVDTSGANVHLESVPVMSFRESNFAVDGALYKSLSNWILKGRFLWTELFFNWENPLSSDDRAEVASEVKSHLTAYLADDSSVTYDDVTPIVELIKDQTIEEAMAIFDSFQLFEGTYKA